MEPFRLKTGRSGEKWLEIPHRGVSLLRHASFNKGTAFTAEERVSFGLTGLLPHGLSTLEKQCERVGRNLRNKPDALEKYIGLSSLQDRNETLFHRLLLDNLEELLPIIYTPTVGLACQRYSHIFRRARGLWITPEHQGKMGHVLENAPFDDIRLIVVTDNERILGLGDQGAGGIGIPIGKLALYTAAAGIHPTKTLAISLDVGTDNASLLADELYLGCRIPRIRGDAYDRIVDEFVQAVRKRFPQAIVQWEDFKKGNAFKLLERYRRVLPSFNDDIQGTAAVTMAGILAACRVTGTPVTSQRIVILGAGAAGVGIAQLLRETLCRMGMGRASLPQAVAVLDSQGLLVGDVEICDAYKRSFAWPADYAAQLGLGKGKPRDLLSVVRALHPTVLVGTSGQPGVFDEATVREMAVHAARPVILPLSNPTSLAEATPADLFRWTGGRAIVATGSPFDPVSFDGRTKRVGQCNNVYIFPGVGLGALVSGATEITDAMFSAAAEALSLTVSNDDLAGGNLYPPIGELRRVARSVASAVARVARDSGVGRVIEDADIADEVQRAMWDPQYLPYEAV
jgi:malic enzyme